jgi:hypothetical protein
MVKLTTRRDMMVRRRIGMRMMIGIIACRWEGKRHMLHGPLGSSLARLQTKPVCLSFA